MNMREKIAPVKILFEVKNSILSKIEATEMLISLFEGSDNENIRLNSLKAFQEIDFKSTKIFKLLENCLISDENQIVRSVAAKLLMHDYIKEGVNSLTWAIQHDKSPIVIKTFIDVLREIENNEFLLLKEKSLNWLKDFASNIDIVPEEAEFILDIEILFAKGKKKYIVDSSTYNFYKYLRDVRQEEPWLEVHNNHIIGLNLKYFNWLFLKENPKFLKSSTWLRYPNMFLNSLRRIKFNGNYVFEIPKSIGLLTSLEWLNLSHNNLQKIPESLKNLKSLKKLDLRHNNIKEIPSSLEPFVKSIESFKI